MSDETIVAIDQRDDVFIAVVRCDRMSEVGTRAILEQLTAEAERVSDLPVVLDMSAVEFVPSLSLGALVTCLRAG